MPSDRPRATPSAFLLLFLVGAVAPLPAQRQVSAPETPACARCSIALRPTARITHLGPAGELAGPPESFVNDARGRLWVFAPPRPPVVFGPSGEVLTMVGTEGSGPGEFRGASGGVPLPGDSMLVIDGANGRAVVVSPALVVARYVSLPHPLLDPVVLRWPDRVVMSGHVPSPSGAGLPLHLVSFAASNARVTGSFGPGDGELHPLQPFNDLQITAPTANGRGFWSADLLRYRATRWSATGEPESILLRAPPWFSQRSKMGIGTHDSPPPPMVTAIHEDKAGLLWVYIRVPAPSWRRAWGGVPREVREIQLAQLDLESLFHTMIEVLDPAAGRVVSRQLLDTWVVGMAGDGTVVTWETMPDGSPFLTVSTPQLSRP